MTDYDFINFSDCVIVIRKASVDGWEKNYTAAKNRGAFGKSSASTSMMITKIINI